MQQSCGKVKFGVEGGYEIGLRGTGYLWSSVRVAGGGW